MAANTQTSTLDNKETKEEPPSKQILRSQHIKKLNKPRILINDHDIVKPQTRTSSVLERSPGLPETERKSTGRDFKKQKLSKQVDDLELIKQKVNPINKVGIETHKHNSLPINNDVVFKNSLGKKL